MARRALELGEKALAKAVRDALNAGQKKLIAVGGAPGLHLQVRPTGQAWIFRYQAGLTEDGRPWRRDMGLGSYPDVPLAEAREMVRDLRKAQREGIDPIDHKRAQAPRVRPTSAMTFDEAAKRLIAAKAPEWRNAKHGDQWRNTLATYASPILGKMPVDTIDVHHVEAVLAPIWMTKTETAKRVRMRIEAVLDWAKVAKQRDGENPARWAGNLAHLLAKPNKVAKVENQPALPYSNMHRFVRHLRTLDGSARAIEFLVLTATRSGEVRGATWEEIDLEAATWTIPAERMKADREHVVPLSPQALRLLDVLPRTRTSPLVFPSARGRELSENTLANRLRLMHEADVEAGGPGYVDPKQRDENGKPRVAVPHGFRSTFRDWASECTNFPRDLAESALAHSLKDKTEAAYRRGDMLTKRAKMMTAWADYIDTAPAVGNVTPFRLTA
jgi:integrase